MDASSTFIAGLRRVAGLVTLAICAIAPAARAQYELPWYTIDGGGRSVYSGGSYGLSATIGQPDAGFLSGGSYTVSGGFWFGAASTVAVEEPGSGDPALGSPLEFRLYAPAPNPSRQRTSITFDLPAERPVRLRVHDPAGRLVRTLADAMFPAGRHRVTWDGIDDDKHPAATGIYFLQLEAGPFRARHKLALIR